MKRKKLKQLLEYEVALLKWGRKVEEVVQLFGIQNPDFEPNLPFCNYELMGLVLDDLGVPKDSNKTPRDPYNDVYYNCWSNEELTIDELLDEFERIKNENKRRVRK